MRHLILLPLILISYTSWAQTYQLQKESTLEVYGTSSLHDWDLKAEELSGEAKINASTTTLDIQQLDFKVKAESLKSHKSGMDKNTYDALKTDEHPYISYTLESVEEVKGANNAYTLKTKGYLTLAGTKKLINLTVNAQVVGNTINFIGETTFSMSQFNIEPPTALMGTIKTGDKITIKFNTTYRTK